MGRFLNRNPIGFAGGLNLFSYGGNNPVTMVDPDGLREGSPRATDLSFGINHPPQAYVQITDEQASSGAMLMLELVGEFYKPLGLIMNAKGIYEDFSDGVTPGDFVQFVPFGKIIKKAKRRFADKIPCPTIPMSSSIGKDPGLVRHAEKTRRSVSAQDDIDDLFLKFSEGHPNPGLGNKHLFGDIFEARGRNQGRLYFRHLNEGIDVVGKSHKGNQNAVIDRLKELYE